MVRRWAKIAIRTAEHEERAQANYGLTIKLTLVLLHTALLHGLAESRRKEVEGVFSGP